MSSKVKKTTHLSASLAAFAFRSAEQVLRSFDAVFCKYAPKTMVSTLNFIQEFEHSTAH
jgi:hypothetical protein